MDKVTLKIRSQEILSEADQLKVFDAKTHERARELVKESEGAIKSCEKIKSEDYKETAYMNKIVLYFANASNLITSKINSYALSVRQSEYAEKERQRQIEENQKRIKEHQKYLDVRATAKTDEHKFHEQKDELRKESLEVQNQPHISHAEVKKRLGRPPKNAKKETVETVKV